MPEVEPDVLAVARAADAALEERAVGVELEEVGAVSEVGGSLLLRAEVEGDALALELGYLGGDVEQGLGALRVGPL